FKSQEESLQAEINELKAKLRKREQKLFGKKSEKSTQKQDQLTPTAQANIKKNRGQQADSKGHGKRDYNSLPAIEKIDSLSDKNAICSCCRLQYEELNATENSEILEVINVKAYRRMIRRKM